MIEWILLLGLLNGQGHAPPAARAPQTFGIRGVVVDATTGVQVAGAEVSIFIGGDEAKTTAGGDGAFAFGGLEAGKYPLYAAAQGYVAEGYKQHGQFLTAIVVGKDLDSEHIVFKLHPQALIYGTVTDENGDAVRRAQVTLMVGGGGHQSFVQAQAQTNDLGEYRFAHLAAGKYHVVVQARPWYAENGFRYVPRAEQNDSALRIYVGKPQQEANPSLDLVYPITFYPGVTDENAAGEIDLIPGEKEEANIAMQAVPSVHIRITGLPTNEEQGVNISAQEKLFGSFDASVDAARMQIAPGEYEIAGLPPGNIRLTVNSGQGDQAISETIKTNLSDGDRVDATEGERTAKVTGRLILPDGSGREGSVRLANDEGQMFSAKLQRDGTFSLAAVQGGIYKVIVDETNQQDYVLKIVATGAKVSGHDLTIAGAGDVGLVVTLGEGVGTVTGMARLDGKAEAGAMILLVPESGEEVEDGTRMDQSDSDGTFTLANILPGKYVLMAIEDGWGLKWRDKEVLKPYREKGQVLQVGANGKLNMSVEVQRKVK